MSGGLDSVLASKYLMTLGVDLIGFHHTMPFGLPLGGPSNAERLAKQIGLPLIIESRGEAFFKLVENPLHGYGAHLNPCIDCRIMGLRRAKELMVETGAQFVVTGEVLGQRPMSQRKDAMRIIDRDADLEGLILRPLCAKNMPPTLVEQNGWVDRDKMLDFKGRGRKQQIALAKKLGVVDFPNPAGGCVLTEPQFSKKVAHLLEFRPNPTTMDWNMLCVGRHIILNPKTKAVVSRDEKENDWVKAFTQKMDVYLEPVNFLGPSAAICGPYTTEDIALVGSMMLSYGHRCDESVPTLLYENDKGGGILEIHMEMPREQIAENIIC